MGAHVLVRRGLLCTRSLVGTSLHVGPWGPGQPRVASTGLGVWEGGSCWRRAFHRLSLNHLSPSQGNGCLCTLVLKAPEKGLPAPGDQKELPTHRSTCPPPRGAGSRALGKLLLTPHPWCLTRGSCSLSRFPSWGLSRCHNNVCLLVFPPCPAHSVQIGALSRSL